MVKVDKVVKEGKVAKVVKVDKAATIRTMTIICLIEESNNFITKIILN